MTPLELILSEISEFDERRRALASAGDKNLGGGLKIEIQNIEKPLGPPYPPRGFNYQLS